MHAEPEYDGALFQVAIQFNALQMIGPEVTPEDGVTRYQFNRSQGAVSAIAAGAGTIYRNDFTPVAGRGGRTADPQLDGLGEIGFALRDLAGREEDELWQMRNGYALCDQDGLEAISKALGGLNERELEALRAKLSISLQDGVEVTDDCSRPEQQVSRAFCSALPVAHMNPPQRSLRPFATLVLEAAYEATLLEGVVNAGHVSEIVVLTVLGGGALGNESEWILNAIKRALGLVTDFDLDIRIVTDGPPSSE